MKKLIFAVGTVAVVALASCSNDETVSSTPVNPNEISYSIAQTNASRSADLFSSSVLPDAFYVMADAKATDGDTYSPYFATEKVTKGTGDTYTSAAGTHYWPENALSFYAFYGAYGTDGNEITSATPSSNVVSMAVKLPATVADQHDFIYAYKKDVTKTTDGKVKLNFRHALAQIAFQAKSKSRGIYVEIQKVELANIIDRGTVTFGGVQENETSDQYKGTGTFTNQCTWSNLGTDKITPAVALTSSVAVYPGISSGAVAEMDPVVIKDAASTTNGSNGAMFAIPQSVNAWDGTGSGTDLQTRANGSMYFLVWAKIRNVADATNGLKATDTTYLWGDANNFKAIGVKIDTSNISAWAAGKKYIYTFIFGQDGSNGGIDPANPDNPVLVPITYDTTVISVDDWADGGNQNIDMKK